MLGALCSLDVMLFYVFFEAMLIPMYLMIGVWGAEERQMAAMKFFLYTLVGSLLMLVAFLAIYLVAHCPGAAASTTPPSTTGCWAPSRSGPLHRRRHLRRVTGLAGRSLHTYGPVMFAAFAIAFAIKVPMFPLHTWLPDAHVQAPVAGSMVLAGVMLKMGTFGFWRFALPAVPRGHPAGRAPPWRRWR